MCHFHTFVFHLIHEQATTPVDPRVLDAMLPYFTDQFGNPHSRTHAYGWEAEHAVETGRKVRK
jgi:cysteine desulfurase